MSEVRLAFDAQNHLGETPVWSERDQALWWVNCEIASRRQGANDRLRRVANEVSYARGVVGGGEGNCWQL